MGILLGSVIVVDVDPSLRARNPDFTGL